MSRTLYIRLLYQKRCQSPRNTRQDCLFPDLLTVKRRNHPQTERRCHGQGPRDKAHRESRPGTHAIASYSTASYRNERGLPWYPSIAGAFTRSVCPDLYAREVVLISAIADCSLRNVGRSCGRQTCLPDWGGMIAAGKIVNAARAVENHSTIHSN